MDIRQVRNLPDNQKLLLTVEINWADEFDMQDWKITDAKRFKEVVRSANKRIEPEHEDEGWEDPEIEWYFGTNEFVTYSDGPAMLREVTVTLITDEEYNTIEKLFQTDEFGTSCFFSELFNL